MHHHSSCDNLNTGLFSCLHWPRGQALHNVWPWGESLVSCCSFLPLAASATPMQLSPLRKIQLHVSPGTLLLQLTSEDQVWVSLVSRRWEGKKGWVAPSFVLLLNYYYSSTYHSVLFLAPNWLHISPGWRSVCFTPYLWKSWVLSEYLLDE